MTDQRKDLPPVSSPNFLEKVREAVSVYLGNRGDSLDQGLTRRDLLDAGVIGTTISNKVSVGVSSIVIPTFTPIAATDVEPDLTPPPTPTGFTVSAAISNLLLGCDNQTYTMGHGHAKSILYGASWISGALPVFASAVSLSEFAGTVSSYATNPSTTWHLWLKWVTVDGVKSTVPAGGVNGVVVTTGQDVALLLAALTGEITVSELHNTLGTRIDLIDVGATALTTKVAALESTYGSTANAATSAASAAASAATATQAKVDAITAQGGAANSATTATTKAGESTTSATNASGSASTASTHATTASTAATNAGNSATAASTSATNAATYATNSETSSTASTTAKVAAESAQSAAGGSATAAATSASTASTQATNAGTSATSAATSATTATTKAGDALTYSNNAATSASNASGSATTASTQAGLSATSNTASGVSAAAALASQTASATSESNASGSAASASSTLTNINAVVAGAASAAVATEATARINADNSLYAQYTVKLDVDGKVSGFGLASTGPTGAGSTFEVRADKFVIAAPAGAAAGYVPFAVLTAPTVIGGVTLPPGVYATSAYILDGQITNAKIGALAVDNAKIADLSVAKLTSGSVAVGQYIQSTGYVSGSAGWKISADGTAELSNAIVRGAVYASSGSFTGAVTATSGSFTGAVYASSGSFTGAVTATSGSFTGAVYASSGSFTGAVTATSGSFTGYITASSFATTPDANSVTQFRAFNNGTVIADLVDIRRRAFLENGSLDPTDIVSGGVWGTDGNGSPTFDPYGAGTVIRGQINQVIYTGVTDLATQSATANQPYYVAAYFNGGAIRSWTGAGGTTFDFYLRAHAAPVRTYSNSGTYANNGLLSIVFDYAVVLTAGSFTSFRLPTATWTVYKL